MCEILLHCSHYIIVLTAHAHLHTIRYCNNTRRGTYTGTRVPARVQYCTGTGSLLFLIIRTCVIKILKSLLLPQQLHCAPTSCFGPDLAHPNKPPGTYYRLATSSSAMANGSPQVRRDDLKETDSAGFDWEEIDQPVTPTDREHLIAPPKPAVQVK